MVVGSNPTVSIVLKAHLEVSHQRMDALALRWLLLVNDGFKQTAEEVGTNLGM